MNSLAGWAVTGRVWVRVAPFGAPGLRAVVGIWAYADGVRGRDGEQANGSSEGRELRTIRELRLAVREIEAELERVHMSPATALPGWGRDYLHRARTALRQAERHFAASDPDSEPLKPLSPTLGQRRVDTRPRRKRYRCPVCFVEQLLSDSDLEHHYDRHRYAGALCSGAMEPLARMKQRHA